MLVNKKINMTLLQQELDQAGVPYRVLIAAPTDIPGEINLHDQSDVDGSYVELPTEAQPVVDAHVAPPLLIEYPGTKQVDAVLRTTDDIPVEVFRFATEVKHVYTATFQMTAVDAVSGATKRSSAEMVFKRLATSLVQVGSTVPGSTFQDTAAASWQIQPLVQVTDLVIMVRGASGRTIDWILVGDIGAYAPEGM